MIGVGGSGDIVVGGCRDGGGGWSVAGQRVRFEIVVVGYVVGSAGGTIIGCWSRRNGVGCVVGGESVTGGSGSGVLIVGLKFGLGF